MGKGGLQVGRSGSLRLALSRQQTVEEADFSGVPALSLHAAIVGEDTSVLQIGKLAPQLGITEEDLGLRCGISRPTLHRRKKVRGSLSRSESDVLARHALLLAQATAVFEDENAARDWLRTPQVGLGRAVPLDLALSTTGFREVEKLLTRIDRGVYA